MKAFPKNSRVCFIGDSITHNNGYVSHIVRHYRENLKELNVNFYNCGIAGGSLATTLTVLDEDVFSHKPTHAVIMIGMNDSGRDHLKKERGEERYKLLRDAFEKYKENYSLLLGRLEEKGVKIILCTPTPYDEYRSEGYDVLPGGFALIAAYADYVRTLAAQSGYPLCDYHTYISKLAQTQEVINPDRVHPNEDGHYHIAKCFLAFQGLEIDEKKPFPQYMSAWREKVEILRNLRATEHLCIKDYSLSEEDRIKRAQKCLVDMPKEQKGNMFWNLLEDYIKFKPLQKHLERECSEIMENMQGGSE